MVVSIGEILADMICEVCAGEIFYHRCPGGAPFNVACAVKKCGGKVGFVGKVGDDAIGRALVKFAESKEFDLLRVTVDRSRNTTLAFVDLDDEGERSFTFYRKHTADYAFAIDDVKEAVAAADIVHIGSLMLSEPEGISFFEAVATEVKRCGKLLSFDVNFREDIFRNRADAIAVYTQCMKRADILKLSDNEINMFTEEPDRERALRIVAGKSRFAVLTCGAHGAAFLCDGVYGEVPTISVHPVDTTGAGDAFYGALLSRLDLYGFDAPRECIRFANICGALTTTRSGSAAAIPTLDEIGAYLK